jgi:putative DNA primase/helicase
MHGPRELKLPLRDRARGRWKGILPALGVPMKFMNGKHQACPMCGGKDRARFDNKDGDGTYFCTNCGAGDGIKLVMEVNGCDFKEAAKKIEAIIDSVKPVAPKPGMSDQAKREAMNKLWQSSKRVEAGDPVALWLENRVGPMREFPRCLRYSPETKYIGEDGISNHPAMIALVTAPDGNATILHRTYLTKDGRKADIKSVRRMMPGEIEDGSAVRLCPATETLGVAEGIETAIAAAKIFRIPVWSVINSSLMAKWIVPEGVKEVVIFGDNDPGYAGQAAAYTLAKRLAVNKELSVKVEIPEIVGWDWNNVLDELFREKALA